MLRSATAPSVPLVVERVSTPPLFPYAAPSVSLRVTVIAVCVEPSATREEAADEIVDKAGEIVGLGSVDELQLSVTPSRATMPARTCRVRTRRRVGFFNWRTISTRLRGTACASLGWDLIRRVSQQKQLVIRSVNVRVSSRAGSYGTRPHSGGQARIPLA